MLNYESNILKSDSKSFPKISKQVTLTFPEQKHIIIVCIVAHTGKDFFQLGVCVVPLNFIKQTAVKKSVFHKSFDLDSQSVSLKVLSHSHTKFTMI